MGAGVGNTVHRVVVGQIVAGAAGIAGIKGKLQHLHAGKAAVPYQLPHGIAHVAKVFRNDIPFAQCLLHSAEKLNAGAFLPVTVCSGLAAVGNGEILVKTAEVVDAHYIVQLKAVLKAGDGVDFIAEVSLCAMILFGDTGAQPAACKTYDFTLLFQSINTKAEM